MPGSRPKLAKKLKVEGQGWRLQVRLTAGSVMKVLDADKATAPHGAPTPWAGASPPSRSGGSGAEQPMVYIRCHGRLAQGAEAIWFPGGARATLTKHAAYQSGDQARRGLLDS